jgi:pimeloyl-ACP methyl ester carboxylesterase
MHRQPTLDPNPIVDPIVAPLAPPDAAPLPGATPGTRGHLNWIVTLTMVGGLLAAIIAVAVPFAGAEEHVIAGSVLLVFASSWALLGVLTTRRTDQPQTWAYVPAVAMGAAAVTILVLSPTGNEAGWVWPPLILALVAWMVVRSRRDLRSRVRNVVLYPVFVALALSAVGGTYETYRETRDAAIAEMPGRLVDVGGHRLHINCVGSGSPTVVLEGGLGEVSPMMASWIAPDVAPTTRVCVYDRAGRGWSEAADAPQDGTRIATDLHTLLAGAGETGPYVLAGHSAGGIYVLNFARLFPQDVAGVALLDSMHPEQYERMASWPSFYEMYRRASAVMPPLARLGLGRLVNDRAFTELPPPQRNQERAFLATPRHNRSIRDEVNQIRTALDQAADLQTLGSTPLAVVTASRGHEADWFPMQDDLVTLSTNSAHLTLANATHAMVVADENTARQTSNAIIDVVDAVRTNRPITVRER